MPKTPNAPKKPEDSASRRGRNTPRSLNHPLDVAANHSQAADETAVQTAVQQDWGYETPDEDNAQSEASTPTQEEPHRQEGVYAAAQRKRKAPAGGSSASKKRATGPIGSPYGVMHY